MKQKIKNERRIIVGKVFHMKVTSESERYKVYGVCPFRMSGNGYTYCTKDCTLFRGDLKGMVSPCLLGQAAEVYIRNNSQK